MRGKEDFKEYLGKIVDIEIENFINKISL